MVPRTLVVAFAALAVAGVAAQPNRIDIVSPLAPELAAFGPLDIGVRTIQVTDRNRPDVLNTKAEGPIARYDRTLALEVWYPAALAAGEKPGTEYRTILHDPTRPTTLLGRGVRDASPRAGDGPFPLVIISHGYPGNRFLMSHLSENLASKGYVTVAIDHKDSTYDDQKIFGSTLYNRPYDQLFVLNEMARLGRQGSGSFLAGLVDADRTGIIGYSMGGYGVINVIGGGFSQAGVAASAAPPNGLLAERAAANPEYRRSMDARVKAAIAIGPWGMQNGFWDAEGLAGIRTPVLFIAGSVDDVSGYEKGVRALYEGAVNAERYLLTFLNANHNAGAPVPAPVESYVTVEPPRSSPFSHYADAVWDTTRMNNITQHFATAWFDWRLKDDLAKREYFNVVREGRSGVWSVFGDGRPQESHTYWKGFKRRTAVGLTLDSAAPASPQQTASRATQKPAAPPPSTERAPTRADILRGEYGRYRANNDLLHYHLDIRVDPDRKIISGRNTIRFRMLTDDTRIQLDLYANLNVDRILLGGAPLQYARELNTVFVDFPETLRAGRDYAIEFHYSGTPVQTGRFGGFTFARDSDGHHWIYTSCEGPGASLWWPNKDQWRDEPEGMDLSVAIPSRLVDVSNGRFLGKKDLGDGYTRWDWRIHYPINNYNVSVNIGNYVHFGERLGDLTLDYYVLPGSLEKAKTQFSQTKPMLEAFNKVFGEYPFAKDGFKLIEVPYAGMEHQSAVTYGNRFANGYLERDWTGVGVSLKFDFIIIHESAHEWFGNAVSAADVSDMWIQEGWTTYLEAIYVEHLFGYDDAIKYVNGYKSKVGNKAPVITQRGIHRSPDQDQYFKGALFLHTLRNVVADDGVWWKLVRDVYHEFKYRNVMTEDLVRFVNTRLGRDLTPVFDQYLRRAELPALELTFNDDERTVAYRWNADERAFDMPVRVGRPGAWQVIRPTTDWQVMPLAVSKDAFEVATDLYYVDVVRK
jgi:predicted dienelactone hydrolase